MGGWEGGWKGGRELGKETAKEGGTRNVMAESHQGEAKDRERERQVYSLSCIFGDVFCCDALVRGARVAGTPTSTARAALVLARARYGDRSAVGRQYFCGRARAATCGGWTAAYASRATRSRRTPAATTASLAHSPGCPCHHRASDGRRARSRRRRERRLPSRMLLVNY